MHRCVARMKGKKERVFFFVIRKAANCFPRRTEWRLCGQQQYIMLVFVASPDSIACSENSSDTKSIIVLKISSATFHAPGLLIFLMDNRWVSRFSQNNWFKLDSVANELENRRLMISFENVH